MANFKGNAERYRPQQNAYKKQWLARQPPTSSVRSYKLSAEQRAKKAEYQRKWRTANRAKVNEAQRKGYAAKGKHTYAHKTRKALLKHNHIRNLELLAARQKPDRCDACGGAKGGIVFDHCHRTLNFRGWLCNGCNRALGFVNDDAPRLRMLAAYVERTKNGQGAQLNIPGI
jgi:hypothetical protein